MSAETFEIGQEYLGIMVDCPFCAPSAPAPEHARPVGVFIETELGRQVLVPLIETADSLQQDGLKFEEAVDIAFRDNAMRNEKGAVVTLSMDEVLDVRSGFSEAEFIVMHGDTHEFPLPTNSSKTLDEIEKEKLPAQEEKITVNTFRYVEKDGVMQVIGEVTNNDSSQRPVRLRAVFYDKDGKVLGSSNSTVGQVDPGAKQPFTLIVNDDVAGYANIKVSADT